MNRHVVGALFEDAFRQVLDDKVFRLLVVIAVALVLPTFLVGFRPEGVSMLFGWKTWTYEELAASFGGGRGSDPQAFWIAGIQQVVVDGLAGSVGLLFCIAATAFFVPRMLEKGAADTLFSKPVGRFALLAARYAAGVIFVACLSFLLVLGMHVGFLVGSGHSDPAFLWSALTLTYVFALVHSVSVTVAVFTRSSIAAILTTLLFFVFTGCVQKGWIEMEHRRAAIAEAVERGEEEVDTQGRFGFLLDSLNALHWALPKTTDADYVVAGLRRSITESDPKFRDSNGYVSVVGDPKGFRGADAPVADLATAPVAWVATDASGAETARISLSRRDRSDPAISPGGKTKLRAPNSFASDYAKQLVAEGATTEKPSRSSRNGPGRLAFSWVRWQDRADKTERAHGFAAVEEALYELDVRFTPSFGTGDERQEALDRYLDQLRAEKQSASTLTTESWYTRVFGWSSPWRFNAFVSIGTSLLFAFVLLLFARWRLARIDF